MQAQPNDPQDLERPRFTVIHYSVLTRLSISATEYMILDMVYHLSAKTGYCYKSPASIALELNMSKRGVNHMIVRLIERELLGRSAAGLIATAAWIDAAYVERSPARDKMSRSGGTKSPSRDKTSRQVGQNFPQVGQKFQNNRGLDIQENDSRELQYSVKPGKPVPQRDGKTINDLLRLIITTLGYTDAVKLLDQRKLKLKQRLKTYTPAEILKAAQAVADDDFMNGSAERNTAGKRYGNIDYLLRSDQIIDQWLNGDAEAQAKREQFKAAWL